MITPNRIGVAVAILYLAGALYVIADERKRSSFLPTLGTGLVTAPITLPLEWLGFRPDLRNMGVVGGLLLANAGLMYGIGYGVGRILVRTTP
jgi:hypothetical protein